MELRVRQAWANPNGVTMEEPLHLSDTVSSSHKWLSGHRTQAHTDMLPQCSKNSSTQCSKNSTYLLHLLLGYGLSP